MKKEQNILEIALFCWQPDDGVMVFVCPMTPTRFLLFSLQLDGHEKLKLRGANSVLINMTPFGSFCFSHTLNVRTFLPLLHNSFSCTSLLLQWSMILLPRPKIHDSWNLNDFETFYLQTSWFILDIPKTIAPSPPLNLKPVPHYVAFWALYQT